MFAHEEVIELLGQLAEIVVCYPGFSNLCGKTDIYEIFDSMSIHLIEKGSWKSVVMVENMTTLLVYTEKTSLPK